MEYKRVTERKTKACTVCRETRTCPQGICWRETIYNRLQELEDKIEQGTLKEIPENAVVLTREELERIKGFSREEVDEISETAIKNSRKETAEKFAEKARAKARPTYVNIDDNPRKDSFIFLSAIDEICKEITEG